MEKKILGLYQKISDLKSKKEFTDEIKKRKKDYNDLFDEETIALLIIDELGRNKEHITKIKDLNSKKDATVIGKVTQIYEKRTFNRKNGGQGRVVNIEIQDNSGICNLVLWDDDVELITDDTIKTGTIIKIINGYVKNGYTGLEINVGRWGMLEIDPKEEIDIKKIELKNDKVSNNRNVSGEIVDIFPTNPFFKDDGSYGFVTKIKIKNKDGTHTLSLWDEKVKEIQKYKIGQMINLENLHIKQKNGSIEYHVNGKTQIKKA